MKNPILMERIAVRIAPIPVRRSDELGVPTAAREAMAFAVLADMTLRGQPACLPPVTAPPYKAARQGLVPLKTVPSGEHLSNELKNPSGHYIAFVR